MPLSVIWFWILLFISLLILMGGRELGRQLKRCSKKTARWVMVLIVFLIAVAALPRFFPTLLHAILPLSACVWLEGIPACFPWMLMTGTLWTGPYTERLRRPARWMVVLGIVYFLFGSVWMILPNVQIPVRENRTGHGLTLQARPDTCVAAASATALRMLGIESTENEMCYVTMVKPSRGSTLTRAAYGLRDYLKRRNINVVIRNISAEKLSQIATPKRPCLVIIRSGLFADHMVVVMGRVVILGQDDGIVIANPSIEETSRVRRTRMDSMFGHGYFGYEIYPIDEFEKLYRGSAIVFEEDQDNTLPGP